MRYLATLIFSILWVLSSSAQDFGTHWISYPLPSDSAEVLFRQSYLMEGRPLQASRSQQNFSVIISGETNTLPTCRIRSSSFFIMFLEMNKCL